MSSLPTSEVVSHVFKSLLRRNVTVKELPPGQPPQNASIGIYKLGDGLPAAACVADLSLAAFSAAAFSLIPARVAGESVKSGILEDGLDEIFGEVLNVTSRLFTSHETHRITLMQTSYPPSPVPDLLKQKAQSPGAFFQVDIEGYGSGLLALFLLNG